MSVLTKLTVLEARLASRDVTTLLLGVLLPSVLLGVLASIPGLSEPGEDYGGLRFIDVWVPSLVVLSVATVGLTTLPQTLATYRERGVLRRLSTTPVHPANLLVAQLLVNLLLTVIAVALLIGLGRVAFGVALPVHLLGFAATFLLGTTAVFAMGLVVAALAPGNRAATGYGTLLFMLTLFFGGVYVPRVFLPGALQRVGDYLPPGVQALQDAWTGSGPQAAHLLAMAVITVVLAALAARLFRWE